MDEKKDFLDELAQNGMLAAIVVASICTLLSVALQFFSKELTALFTQAGYYAYGWMVFLSLGPAVKRAAFMRIDLLADRYQEKIKNFLKLLCDAILFVLMVLMCWFSIQKLMEVIASGAINEKAPFIPLALAYIAPVLGYGLGSIAWVIRFAKAEKGGDRK